MSIYIVFYSILGITAAVIPSYLHPCSVSDGKCLAEHGTFVLQNILKGDPQFKIPPLNPLVLPSVTLENSGLTVTFTNLLVMGIPDIKLTSVKIDPVKKTGKVVFFYPRTELAGDYKGHGKVSLLTLDAADKASIVVDEGLYTWTFNYDIYEKNGAKYAKIKKHNCEFKMKKASLDFKNIVNGDEQLSAATNKVINEEWETVFDGLKGSIGDTIGSVLNMCMQAFMDKIPFDQLVKL